ncbi:hypothetical protein [Streptomyces lichenis]|uniref:DOD-type homing endonuclease domain-containing protein n=1 Tax=Streptomyces lichenis TaxID=2306967 RepID=A0ABT0I980_9ACTN|nr:hypothetical protein [Streptomyces lichenis]MCK8677877.1 hypothetical protein [Streptomyces lichenis]
MASKQMVSTVDGVAQAKTVVPRRALWTLDGSKTARTVVTGVTAVSGREAVEVVTDRVTFTAGPGLLLATPDGWKPVPEAAEGLVAWTPPRKLHRGRFTVRPGWHFGYTVGAVCSDGTVGKNYVSLIVNDRGFASRFADALTACTGLSARLEPVTRPSGYLRRDVPGFRVRVVSSYLADLMRQYVGGDAHHMRQRFPRVVLRDLETFAGFMDGYVDGDGFRVRTGFQGRVVVSANVAFLAEWAVVIGARMTPSAVPGRASRLYISDRWHRRGTYRAESHPLQLHESGWVRVHEVRPRPALGAKPFTFYAYRLDPHPDLPGERAPGPPGRLTGGLVRRPGPSGRPRLPGACRRAPGRRRRR